MGLKQPPFTVLTPEEAVRIVAFGSHTLRPRDDRLYTMQATLLYLTRSAQPVGRTT